MFEEILYVVRMVVELVGADALAIPLVVTLFVVDNLPEVFG